MDAKLLTTRDTWRRMASERVAMRIAFSARRTLRDFRAEMRESSTANSRKLMNTMSASILLLCFLQ